MKTFTSQKKIGKIERALYCVKGVRVSSHENKKALSLFFHQKDFFHFLSKKVFLVRIILYSD